MKNRYLIEIEHDENAFKIFKLVVCNEKDLVYATGESEYLGFPLDELEEIVKTDSSYNDLDKARLLNEIRAERQKVVENETR